MDKYMIFLRSFCLKLKFRIKIISKRFNYLFYNYLYFLINLLLSFNRNNCTFAQNRKLWVLYGRHHSPYLHFLFLHS